MGNGVRCLVAAVALTAMLPSTAFAQPRKKDMPAGPYTLEVIVRGKDGQKLERKQWLDFEIRR